MRALVAIGPYTVQCLEGAAVPPWDATGEVEIDFEAGLVTAGVVRTIRGEAAHVIPGGIPYPVVLGGGAVGRVVSGAAPRARVGDRVVVSNVLFCGRCDQCLAGHDNRCRERRLSGLEVDGTFRSRLRVAASRVVRIPDGLDRRVAVLALEAAVMVRALRLGAAAAGRMDRVCIVGAGSIGIHGVQLATMMGAEHVHAVDPVPQRLEISIELGAEVTANPDGYVDWVAADPAARAPEVVVVVTPAASAVGLASAVAAPRGAVVCVGLPQGDRIVLPDYQPTVIVKELTIMGCYAKAHADFEQAAELLASGGYRLLERVVELPMDDSGAARLEALARRWPDGTRYVVARA